MTVITFKGGQEILIQSILKTRILTNAFTDVHFKQLNLNCYDDIGDLTKMGQFSYNLTIYMIHCLSSQQKELEKMGYSFYTFTKKDIIVVNGCYFFCINPDLIMQINKNKLLAFYKPPAASLFSSPELQNKTSIPFKLTYKTIYYSIGILAIYCLNDLTDLNDLTELTDLTDLTELKNTKLYWFVLRCIDKKEEERTLLLI